LRHVQLEQFARRASYLHDVDPRAKVAALGLFLVSTGTLPAVNLWAYLGFSLILLVGVALGNLPLPFLLARASAVLPFSLTFALISWIAGDTQRAIALAAKSFLSTFAVLLLIGSTPLPDLLRALASLGAPAVLLMVIQFLYRYLFVVVEQAVRMRLAALCRGGSAYSGGHSSAFQRAAGALSVLFARSYGRAEGIHRAMLARP